MESGLPTKDASAKYNTFPEVIEHRLFRRLMHHLGVACITDFKQKSTWQPFKCPIMMQALPQDGATP